MADQTPVPKIDSTVPHSARIFTYWLGGKDHFPVDEEAGDRFRAAFPEIVDLARVGRYFIGRVVGHLIREERVTQFLDIGTGLPTVDNTHEVAQRLEPRARIVYVDNDPLVLAHAEALLTSTPEGRTAYVDADVHDPERILREAWKTLDPGQPVAVLLMGILAHVEDYGEARSIVRRLMAELPPGSFLAVRDGADTDPAYRTAIEGYNKSGAVPYRLRSPEQIAGFLDGLELVEPGVLPCPHWRPEAADLSDPSVGIALYGGLAKRVVPEADG
ncbi:SAM-dependent methyltransferase [Streptomyces sp. N2-109]|uniref:SAM-dependent methyltransferase n=1 Tax=Streptomyces gossypii TaxID=2883101 RepID=A0ABT2JP72_9ACTN|nr:SAM-dependent methyltransferase [Streptomyces gossypii]MCT2589621.1 SAM-dependent methyltransferase [Streptomyces gossypii]